MDTKPEAALPATVPLLNIINPLEPLFDTAFADRMYTLPLDLPPPPLRTRTTPPVAVSLVLPASSVK
jgi:hypothetical protein